MEFRLLGWPEDDVLVRLDHRAYAYAGKFAMSSTGKAVALDDGQRFRIPDEPKREYVAPVGIVAFSEDRTDPDALWLRYVSVRRERRREGVGPRLCAFVVARAADRGYERVRIAVNNAYSYEALHKVGFAWTGRETGIAELVLERPADGPAAVDPERYRAGLATIAERDDLDDAERAFASRKRECGPPPVDDADPEDT
ncbi:GNAT family N-acetyltransferase [Halobaculum lipolyticum]|uniref:GNAT family N-acetyltransferase n=1 Tax=Halobaculum lipolyticum TaxID=3032001 RepID=A0ABD5WGL7_9EURY|nr:GNAT family N-acetyltransferase [Halobaculum sp. DT31]